MLAVLHSNPHGAVLSADELQRLAWKLRPDLQFAKPRFSTQEIVDILAYVLDHRVLAPVAADYETWRDAVFCMGTQLRAQLPAVVADTLPLSDDVMKMVFAEVSGRMPFSRSYVISRFEHVHDGLPYLFFPAAQAKRLLILFSGNAGRKTYNRFSWFWDESEEWAGDTACLFLCDESSHWYVGKEGSDARRIYREIIAMTMASVGVAADRSYTVGASMGGYGAILYAVEMGLGAAIAVHPQLNFRSALRYKEPSWEERLVECGRNFRDLSDEVCRFDHRPLVYLEYGNNAADRCGVDEFVAALCQGEATVIVRHTRNEGHMTDSPLKHHISTIVRFVEDFQGADR
ncbi:MAG: hypothetical protein QE285_03080 [Aquabacterium sp.]|nr:hypothetical protein [Aquabacterium sp.]